MELLVSIVELKCCCVPRSVRSTCELDTDAGSESVPHMSARARASLSLDTVIVGEVDELEEDVG